MTAHAKRHAVEWPTEDGLFLLAEPTDEEVRAAAKTLAGFYNEPTNAALMTNDHAFDAEDVIEQFAEMRATGGHPFLLFLDGELMGDADFREVHGGAAEYAVMVGSRARQAKGLGTRFTLMALALAAGPLGIGAVYAAVLPDNRGSLRMFEKIGFRIDVSPEARRYAEDDDEVCLSMTSAAFRAAHASAVTAMRVHVR